MKTMASTVWVLLLLGAGASAQTLDDLKKDSNGGSTDNVLTYGMGYHQQRFSPLKQVNKETVKRLARYGDPALTTIGEQAQPIVYNGVMYVTNAKATVAIDVATGKQIWKQMLDWPPETPRIVCCGVSNKGAAIYNGKVFRTTLDAHVIAYDAKSGKEQWKSKVAEWKDGFSLTLAPLIANGVLVTGISGAEFGIRGSIDGWIRRPEGDYGGNTPFLRAARGATRPGRRPTTPGRPAEARPGSLALTTPSSTLCIGASQSRAVGLGDASRRQSLYLVGAGDWAKTGEVAWHYQLTPNDPYDFDACWELINADIDVGGQKRKVIMQLNRNGFLYVIDRATGKLIAANPFEQVNWATHIDKETGRPVETEVGRSALASRSRCGHRRAVARIGPMRPSIQRQAFFMPPRCTEEASTSIFRSRTTSSGNAISSSRTGRRRPLLARLPMSTRSTP